MTALEKDRERVLVVAFRTGAVRRVNKYAFYLGHRGIDVDVLVADGQGWKRADPIDDVADVYSLGAAENRVPLIWLYSTVVERVPAGVLRRLEHRLPGGLGKGFGLARKAHRKIAGKLRKWVFWKLYRPLRPQTLRRLAMRRLGPLDLATLDKVVIADDSAVPFGWRLTRRFPELEVTRALDRGPYRHLPGPEPGDDDDESEAPPAPRARPYIAV